MIDYCILNINDFTKEFLETKVSRERIEKASKYRFEEDRLRSLCAEYALNILVERNCPEYGTPVSVSYDEYGKPGLVNAENKIYISLSHSSDYAVAMICDKACGIDIEKDSRDLTKIAKRFFTEEEYMTKDLRLLDIWTRKESVLKATGRGLSLGMESFCVLDDVCRALGNNYRLGFFEAPKGYSLSYAILDN